MQEFRYIMIHLSILKNIKNCHESAKAQLLQVESRCFVSTLLLLEDVLTMGVVCEVHLLHIVLLSGVQNVQRRSQRRLMLGMLSELRVLSFHFPGICWFCLRSPHDGSSTGWPPGGQCFVELRVNNCLQLPDN